MKKYLKLIGIASVLVIILVIGIASMAMAAGPNANPGTCPNTESNGGICPNPDCPNIDGTGVCPNPDCPNAGDQLKYQYKSGKQTANGTAVQHQYRCCTSQVE